jgi:FAD/FMN-containing dehydrogenase/Fe-S oxidoreductase
MPLRWIVQSTADVRLDECVETVNLLYSFSHTMHPSLLEAQEVTADFIAELRRQIDGEAHFDPFTRSLYSTDGSIYEIQPLGVVIPRSVDDVTAAITVAAKHGVPVLPRGGGTSQAGQTVGAALIIDFSRYLDQVIEINVEERWARVQPGVVHASLDRRLAPYGLQFAPDPSSGSRACLGGMLGNNASGSHALLYGMMVDHVRAVDCVLADGSTAHFGRMTPGSLAQKRKQRDLEGAIYRGIDDILSRYAPEITVGYPRTWRRVGGYNLDRLLAAEELNLASLLTGSEGTLAAVSELEVDLVPRPTRTAVLVIHFDELIESLHATSIILETEPSAVELLDGLLLDLTRSVPAYARQLDFVQGHPRGLLIVEYYGDNKQELVGKLERLEKHLQRNHIHGATVRALEPAQIAQVWGVRKAGLGLLMSMKGDFKPIPFIEDAAVPVEHLADYIGHLEALAAGHDTRMSYYAHASTGLLHVRPLLNLKEAIGIKRMKAISEGAFELVRRYGGAMSAEHGDGLARSEYNERLFGPAIYRAFQEVKSTFDPQNIMNPGKVVNARPMTENLRYGTDYQVIELKTTYDFSRDYGFAGAVEMCNGAGVCRRLSGGTMCPSFQATRDEEHSTRGRANLLRAGLSGVLPPEVLTGPRMYQALDLCLECKACKAECPSAVDMAKLKAQWLEHYHAQHGVPLRSRLFANIHLLNRLGSALAPLSNRVLGWRPSHWLLEKTIGIHHRRQLPSFASTSFHRWFRRRPPSSAAGRPKVVLFHDTFMTYNEPQIGIAATELLEAAGFEVVIVEKRRCCGRPMISKGLLPKAQANVVYNVALLAPYAQQGIPIVGCEPSCLLTIRDDYPDLVASDDARLVAQQSYTLEEFLAENGRQLVFHDQERHILVHGHCHQKALVGIGPSLAALSLPPNYHVQEIPSGCCGMAGSFGYEAEHYQLSLQIGELSLLPAVRSAAADVEIVAAGISCRQQVAHATGRAARHPALVLREALSDLPNHLTGV